MEESREKYCVILNLVEAKAHLNLRRPEVRPRLTKTVQRAIHFQIDRISWAVRPERWFSRASTLFRLLVLWFDTCYLFLHSCLHNLQYSVGESIFIIQKNVRARTGIVYSFDTDRYKNIKVKGTWWNFCTLSSEWSSKHPSIDYASFSMSICARADPGEGEGDWGMSPQTTTKNIRKYKKNFTLWNFFRAMFQVPP